MIRVRRQRIRNVTPSVVARLLEVKHSTVCCWIHRKELPALDVGTRGRRPTYLIFRKDLVAFLVRRGMTEERVKDLFGP